MKTKRLKRKLLGAATHVVAVLVLAAATFLPYTPASADPVPDYLYTEVFDLLDFDADARTFAGTIDDDGNTFVGGQFRGMIAFDGMGGSDIEDAGTNPTAFVTKRSSDGSYVWTNIVDASAGWAEVRGLATNDAGDVFATGMFFDTVVFDGVGGSDSVTSANQNTYVTKYNANGSYAWTETFDVSSGGTETRGVALDDTGNIYVGGEFFDSVIFDGVGGSDNVTTTSTNAFITKYSPSGAYDWTSHFDLSSPDSVDVGDLAVDSAGNAYITGSANGNVTYGGSDSVNTGNNAAYMAKFAANGTYQYARTFDVDNFASGGFAEANDIAVDASGNIYFGGDFGSDVIFDGVGGTDTASSSGFSCAFLTKYNADGTYGWTKYVDDANGEATVLGVVTDSSGNVYTAGEFEDDIVFDGIGGSDTQSDQGGSSNAYLTQYEASDGAYGWTKSFDTTNGQAGAEAVMIDNDNFVYMTGYAADTVVFDGVGGTDSVDFSTNGSFRSSFLTKYDTGSSGGGGGGGGDSDGDGASDTTENNGPNSGDANNDGQPDSGQDNVTSAVSAVTSTYIVLVSPGNCQITSMTTSSESSNAVQDSGYSYPYGFVGFRVDCDTPGLTATLTLYHYNQAVSGLVLRKYFPSNNAYTTISGAVIGQSAIGGQNVVTASYQITDGGVLDTDGVADSVIVDPVGLGAPVVGVPNTGLGGPGFRR
jgi:hypothetical protein